MYVARQTREEIFTSLAPMRGLTTRHFMDMLYDCGEPDEYISEFLRVHPTATVSNDIVDLIENRKSVADLTIQLLGKEPKHFLRIAKVLQNYKIKSINLNCGCPMPKIGKKGVGGTLLTELNTIDDIISIISDNTSIPISVKTRIGYKSPQEFDIILSHLARHKLAAVYVHARTVKGMYGEPVDFECISIAKAVLDCPVIANGDIKTAQEAVGIIKNTNADGIMIGRAAISNPWIFRQIDELTNETKIFIPTGENYFNLIEKLQNFPTKPALTDFQKTSSVKKYVIPIADFVDPSGNFPYRIRRATTLQDLTNMCENFFMGE
ncbi:MAG: tRNA-dihydrouridine synthase family protein [Puniceicoccales bacterium]|jgi:tRNA-dihydrouridine synthase|nr:tRNA-dihydrouridine synthase family protein [Puniceicoccales bacterium]